ncbi:MAG: ABC transporter substrate-binding protein [Gemmatimonadaceae bacterium]|nr:ABC transporter substrate-binding protein [Gemmatimonadaceae bacterium]
MRVIALTLAAVLMTGGCTGETPGVLRIADAVPRPLGDRSTLSALESLIEPGNAPRIELIPWSESHVVENTEAAQAARFIDDPSVIAVVGHAGSRGTLLAAPLYRAAGLPLIVPTATARELHTLPDGLYLLAPADDMLGTFLVDRALDSLGVRRLAVLYVADPYGEGIRSGIEERLNARGGSLAGESLFLGHECQTDRLAMRMVVRSLIARTQPDGVIMALPHMLTVCALEELTAVNPNLVLLTSDSFVADENTKLSDAVRRTTHVLELWAPGNDSTTARFRTRMREVTGYDPTPGQAYAYDGFRLAEAAIRSGVRTRKQMRAWLDALGTSDQPAFVGVTGPIDFHQPRRPELRLRALTDSLSRR